MTNLDVCPLRIKQQWFDKIKARKKNREFRDRMKPRYITLSSIYIFMLHSMKTLTGAMLIEFNGFDTKHEQWFTHWVLKLGNIISTDPDEVKRFVYK